MALERLFAVSPVTIRRVGVSEQFAAPLVCRLPQRPALAMVQIVVYIGAIAILFIFAVMLTRKELLDKGQALNDNKGVAGLVSLLSFGGLFLLLNNWSGFDKKPPTLPDTDMVMELGTALVTPNMYLLPFEIASVLLLAALIGAVYVANEARSE